MEVVQLFEVTLCFLHAPVVVGGVDNALARWYDHIPPAPFLMDGSWQDFERSIGRLVGNQTLLNEADNFLGRVIWLC